MIGFIYILSNPSLPGLLKVGKTSKDPRERVKELSNTSIPTEFVLEYFALVEDFDEVEQGVHRELAPFRHMPDREFFRIDPLGVVSVIRAFAVHCEFSGGKCGTSPDFSTSEAISAHRKDFPNAVDWENRRKSDREVSVRGRKVFVPADAGSADRRLEYRNGKWQYVND